MASNINNRFALLFTGEKQLIIARPRGNLRQDNEQAQASRLVLFRIDRPERRTLEFGVGFETWLGSGRGWRPAHGSPAEQAIVDLNVWMPDSLEGD